MRGFVPDYEMVAPPTLGDALRMLKDEPGVWKPFAGGTDLMVLLEAGKLDHKRYLSLSRLTELRGIVAETPEAITVGALTTYTDVLRSSLLCAEFPLLARAARATGSIATQNRGTLGGNIVNASPAADSPPALLIYDARLELTSAGASRWVSYADFHTGYKTMILQPEEIVTRIRLARDRRHWRQSYRKVGTRKAQAISKVCFAGACALEQACVVEARIAFGSVAPVPVRCRGVESLLKGERIRPSLIEECRRKLLSEITPIDDSRSSREYRKRVAQNLLEEFLRSIDE
ncbi:MAG TPA: xanthine dehydrogenase family protein subunit M [Terriglobia bacterium]|nr:xanthine dehydrogenase family protein subunit M [Terriglobia bacterium]